jgi:Flp pilus assembly protein TadB
MNISTRPIVAAPMSFTGSTERITRRGLIPATRAMWAWRPTGPPWALGLATVGVALAAGMLWLAGIYLLAAVWFLVACWYVLIFGVFGLLVFPWRMWRRHQRRQDAQQEQIAALLSRQ